MQQRQAQTLDAATLREQLGYITEDDLRALLGVSLGRLRNRQAAGDLPPRYKLGRGKLYKLAEVEHWIQGHRVSRSAA